jgi:hypothetical protein
MHHALIVGSRVVAGIVGAIAFYFAFFLYEDEEGVWQNRLENLWIAVSDRATVTNSTSIALVNKIGEVLRRGFTQLFGDHMFSFQAVAVSTNLSLAGAILCKCLLGIISARHGEQPDFPIAWGVLVMLLLVFFAALPRHFEKRWAVAASFMSPLCFLIVFNSVIHLQMGDIIDSFIYKIVPVLLFLSVISDFLAVIVLRRLFSELTNSISVIRMLSMIVALIALALVIASSPAIVFVWLHNLIEMESLSNIGRLLWELDAATLLACILPIGMLFVVLVHKLLWPLLSRVIYPISRYQVLSNRKVLVPIGTLCFTFALNLEHVGTKELLKLVS